MQSLVFDDLIIQSLIIQSQVGLFRNNRFIVYFFEIPGISNVEVLTFNAIQVQIPDITVETERKVINNIPFYYLKERSDADLQITFLDDNNQTIRKLFDSWIKQGYDFLNLKRGYIDDICCEKVQIRTYTDKSTLSTSYDEFTKVFPYKINDINLDKTSEGELIYTTVNFKSRLHILK